jgi:cytoskeletal protein RodZ
MASFGENLRRERELRGISLREVADATKISARFLKALEEDRVDQLPGGLFPRAFVRQYCNHLGLDAEKHVAEFLYLNGKGAEAKAPVSVPLTARAGPRGVLFFAAVVLAGVGLSWKLGREPEKAMVAAPTPAAAEAAPAATPPPARLYPMAPPPPVATTVTTSDGLVLTLTAQQDCWVQVTADGQTVLNRVLSGGETTTLEAHGQLVLSVGNAGGLAFRVNDRPGVPLGKAGEVKRNIVINRDNLPSLVQEQQDAPSARASRS